MAAAAAWVSRVVLFEQQQDLQFLLPGNAGDDSAFTSSPMTLASPRSGTRIVYRGRSGSSCAGGGYAGLR